MTVYQEFYWPKASINAVASLQAGVPEDPVNLNGLLANYYTNQVSFIDHGFSRNISISSVNDLSAVIFSVSGLQNGVPVLEDIQGPDNDTVQGTLAFDVITSIFLNGVALDFEIGTGSIGYLPMIYLNTQTNIPVVDYTIQSIFSTANSLKYNAYVSIAKITELGMSYDDLIADTGYFSKVLSDINTPRYDTNIGITRYILTQITQSNVNTDDLKILYLQQ